MDLVALTAETLRLHEQTMPNGVVAETRITGRLPPVLGDDTQLQQVLTNLVLNAAESMVDGGQVTVLLSEETLDAAALQGSAEATPPAVAAEASAPKPEPEPPPIPRTARAATGHTILLVDDEDAVRRTAGRLLSHLGYRVLEADSGAAAFLQKPFEPAQLQATLNDVLEPDGAPT